jgi:LPS-assembly protein
MRSTATLLLLLQVALFAASEKERTIQRYTLYASTLESTQNRVVAKGDILIFNPRMMFSANEALYDQNRSLLHLKGDVLFFYGGKLLNKADELTINLDKKSFEASDLFIKEFQSDLWIRTKKVEAKKNDYILRKASVSSCSPQKPEWEIRFSKGHFHRDKEYVTMYNPRFYVGGIPIFYMPWIAFPTVHTRHTGLLRPVIGFENSENLLLMQPIFIAPSPSWDIELDPQVRLERGMGLYTTLRFADTPHSKGSFTFGFFHEKADYAASHNLKNSIHRGASFFYQNEALFTKNIKDNQYDYKDGLYVDLTALNDIDYLNLKDDRKYAVDKLVTSRINYYISGYDDYAGLYAKYFIDTEKVSNADTLQTLPSLQYHRFSQIAGLKNLYYSIDYKFKNSWRREGLGARQHEFSVPVVFTLPLAKNFLNFSVSENFYYSHVTYTDGNETTPNARYFSNYHQISLSSDLMRRFQSRIHNLQLQLAYTLPSLNKEHGYFADFIPFNLQQKSLFFKMNNYLYNDNGYNYLTDRFTQYYYLDEEDKRYNEAENELIYRYSPHLTLRNALIYSYEYRKVKKIQSGIRYYDDYHKLRLDHTYKDAPFETKINFLSADLSRVIDRHYTLHAGIDYDLDNTFTKEWRVGIDMQKRCWGFDLRYKESVTPSLTSGGTESVVRRGIYLMVRFSHIGGVKYKYTKSIANSQIEDIEIDHGSDSQLLPEAGYRVESEEY